MDLLLSRHPIYSSKVDVAGYEIRSRALESPTAPPSCAPYSMLTQEALEDLVGSHLCYVNLTGDALANGWWKTLPTDKAVLGYFDDFSPDSGVAEELVQIAQGGNRLALTGALSPASLDLFGGRVFAVKFDVTAFTPDDLKDRYRSARQMKTQLLASRVDTYDDLEYCRSLGFDLYQGQFISRVAPTEEHEIPVNRLTMLRVLSKLQDPDLEMVELEKTVSMDAALSYKILTFANSAAISLPQKVNSIGHAVRMVGTDMMRSWASALLLSSVDDKPRDLLTIALVRARMCERLSASLKKAHKEMFFTTGLLSVIDALLDCTMQKALDNLPLCDEVKAALIGRSGPAGEALRCAVAYERADWDEIQFYGMDEAHIRDIYMESISWARKLSSGLLS